jgi:integrase
MGVYLREKKLSSGETSYYLDIYHNKKRWYEFIGIHINKSHPTADDKEKRRLAQEIRIKRENELIVQDNGLIDKSKSKADFISWYENHIKGKRKSNQTHNTTALMHLKKYVGNRPLSFLAITPQWIQGFINYLLSKVSNNTALLYIKDIFAAIEVAVRQEIIPANPFRKIPKHERLRQQNTMRQAFTMEQLQKLAETPCDIHPQIKQVYLFSCFTGLRWSDVNKLKWSEVIVKQIDGNEEWFIYFEQEKTEGIEYMPLADQAIDILKHRKEDMRENNDKSPYAFPYIKEFDDKNQLMYKIVGRALKKWAKAAEMDVRLTFHTGRHTFATNVLENCPDGDLWTVSKLLGHKNILATQIYAHVRDKKKSAAVKALPKLKLSYSKVA